MSEEGPKLNLHGFSIVKKGEQFVERKKEIPLSWYSILGDRSKPGETDVVFSPLFFKKIGNMNLTKTTDKDHFEIKRITGFTLEELEAERVRLAREY